MADVRGMAGTEIPLGITSNPNAAGEELFMIMGLPPEVKLTAGKSYDDFWLVRRKELRSLAIVTPGEFSRHIMIAVTRARTADHPPLTLTMRIEVTSAGAKPGPVPELPGDKPPAAYRRTKNETVLFDKAYDRFKKGDVSGARAIFEYFATKGDSDAAIALGETYDPIVLRQLDINGLTADAASATAWYKKAQLLGDATKARLHLNALNQK